MKNTTIKNLEEMGFRRWTKYGHDRLYIDLEDIGLSVDRYKTGNISSAVWNDKLISNGEAAKMLKGTYYINAMTGEIVTSGYDRKYIDEIIETIEGKLEEAEKE